MGRSPRNHKTNMTKEDLEVLKGFGNFLEKTDMEEGQVGQIELTNEFLDTQIKKQKKELTKRKIIQKH